ncbi:hypothetical protein CPB84DRAFT_1745415 [Gymnopilus junonius]|uniref:F-box domain-containing protein n=1 Tax=Gymnopilus junonius TaxID=109634 RepID=A0A9P5TPR9_GYMJU|nr:hypothetical protein CPB84DRAFT_1745415 [Gymnopilus junonius]
MALVMRSLSSEFYATSEPDDPRAELSTIEENIEKTAAALRALYQRKHQLKMRINQEYCSIRLLPPEIVIEFFHWLVPPFTVADEDEIFTSTPLFLGSICSAWRSIAWSTPTLWTSVNMRLKPSLNSTRTELLGQWLSRTGDLPLSLRLFSDEEVPWGTPSNSGSALEVMRKYSSRWQDLDLRIPTSCYKFLPRREETLPLLRSLHVNPPGGQGERKHVIDMSSSAQIYSLSLSCVFLISMKFRWNQITDLQLEAFYVDECLEALRQTSQLVSCALRNIIRGEDGHAYPDSPLSLPTLRNLSIDNEKDTHIGSLLDSIAAPNLENLSYSGRYLNHCAQICTLVSRAPGLHTFSLARTNIKSSEIFLQLLRGLRSVVKFIFIAVSNPLSSPLNDDVLLLCNRFKRADLPTRDRLLPALQELEYCGAQKFTWPVMLQMLESRQRGELGDTSKVESDPQPDTIADLRSVKLTLTHASTDSNAHSPGLVESVVSQLHSLNGMNVSLTMVTQITFTTQEFHYMHDMKYVAP